MAWRMTIAMASFSLIISWYNTWWNAAGEGGSTGQAVLDAESRLCQDHGLISRSCRSACQTAARIPLWGDAAIVQKAWMCLMLYAQHANENMALVWIVLPSNDTSLLKGCLNKLWSCWLQKTILADGIALRYQFCIDIVLALERNAVLNRN